MYDNETNPSKWKIVCATILDNLIFPFILSSLLMAIWLMIGLPNFKYLWIILFVASSFILNNGLKNATGYSIGAKVFKCNTDSLQSKNTKNWIFGIFILICLAIIWLAPLASNTSTIENDYYSIKVPGGMKAQEIKDGIPMIECLAVGDDVNKCAMAFTINYNTTGITLETMCDMVLGGFNRANVPDVKVYDIEFKGQPAKKITGTLEGQNIEIIAFYSPSGKFSYFMSQGLSQKDSDQILANLTLKNKKTPFVDFETVWNHFYGDKDEWDIYQPIDEGLVLEGWKYDRNAGKLLMKLCIANSSNEIQTVCANPEFAEQFVKDISMGQVMIPLARNYGKLVEIILKDENGNIAYTLPVSQ